MDETKYNIIYCSINLVNGKFYMGMHSTNFLNDGYLGSGTVFKTAVRKYGRHNFYRLDLEFYNSREELVKRETDLITLDFLEKYKDDCYNCNVGGVGNQLGEKNYWYGKHPSEKTKKKMSESKKGEKNYWYKKHLLEETKRKISDSLKGIYIGEKNPYFGKTHSEEIKKKMSESKKGEKNPNFGKKGEKSSNSKLTNINRLEIIEKYNNGVRGIDLAKEYNITASAICYIIKNQNKYLSMISQ